MICKSCGFENPDGMNFCGRCSTPLNYLPTGVITYLFTDIEGSTQLWQQYADRMGAVLARHDALLTAVIEEHEGFVVKSRGEGDSIFAVFVRARDAIAAAAAVQRSILAEPWPSDLSIKVRMALHTGESELRDHDYYGPVVNRCARLRSIAHGGQVVLSQATAELVHDALPGGVTLRDMGVHRLKGIERPERVSQLLHPDLPSDFAPLVSLDTPRHNLPAQLTSFIGRDDEISEVVGLLSNARLVTLAGAGGSGKTRLAQEIGASVIGDYPDGVWFVGLVDITDPNMLRSRVAKSFDVGEDALHRFLEEKTVLIILDNCEHLTAGASSLAQWLLASPGTSLIATSREPLNLPGERMFQVPPLPIPSDNAPELLLDCPSVQLFLDRAQAANPNFELTPDNATAVSQIVRRLDGIPLAIELAASRVRLLQPAEIAGRLDDIFKILTGGPGGSLPHHQTLERTIDWSYDMLESDQQGLFRRLSVFRGGFTLPACAAVSGTDDEYEALDSLSQLVDKSLVRTMPAGEETRYYLLEPLRQYSAARITVDEAADSGGQHARYFQELAEGAAPELQGPQQLEWLARLETEHDNLRAALTFGLESDDVEVAQRIAAALMWFWAIRCHVPEATDWYERVLAADSTPTKARAWALVQAGFTRPMVRLHDLEGCLELLREAQGQFVDLGDDEGVMTARMYIAQNLWFQRDLETASDLIAGIQADHQASGFEWGDAFARLFLGSAAWLMGNVQRSYEHYTKSLELFAGLQDIAQTAWVLLPLANIAMVTNEPERATALYEESLALMGDIGDRQGLGAVLLGMGLAALLRGEAEEAEQTLVRAQTQLRESGGGLGLSWPLSHALVDTHTHDLFLDATRRYEAGVNLPADEWVQMVYSDGEALRAHIRSEL